MPTTKTLPAFTPSQRDTVHRLLAAKVTRMMGRKLEEADWADVDCRAKGIPTRGWSNLNIDVMHQGLGVEHKMPCYRSTANIAQACGATFMHPAAARARAAAICGFTRMQQARSDSPSPLLPA
jgi:hypothetical protein